MAVEGANELAVYFDTDDFALAGTYVKAGGGTSTVNGILDKAYVEVGGFGSVGVVSAEPRFTIRTASLPSGAAEGDAVTIDSVAYTVRVIERDGTGVAVLVLEKN